MPVRRPWQDDPQYQYREDNADPVLRPSVDKLRGKLRHLSNLQNKPEAVIFVAKDMVHWHLVREGQHPAHLWQLIKDLMHEFLMLMDGGFPKANDQKINDFVSQHVQEVLTPASFPEAVNQMMREQYLHSMKESPDLSVGDSPSEEGPVINLEEFLKDDRRKGGVEGIILAHVYNAHMMQCTCKRPFGDAAAWSKHLRMRIWRYLRDEFPPFGKEAGEEAGPVSTP